jgi:hypothetical protein
VIATVWAAGTAGAGLETGADLPQAPTSMLNARQASATRRLNIRRPSK